MFNPNLCTKTSMAEQAREQARHTKEHAEGLMERIRKRSPASSQIVGFFSLLTLAGISLVLGGLTVTGIVITLLLMTPVFLFFSPILVPAGILLFLSLAGVLTASGVGVTTISVLSWAYNYFQGRRPPGSEHIEHARRKAVEMADQTKQKARDLGGQVREQVAQAPKTPGGA